MTEQTSGSGVTRRNVLRTTGAAGVGTVFVAGCLGGDEGDDGEPTETDNPFEIIHWWTAGGEQEALNALLEGYKEEYGYSDDDINNNPAPGGAGSAFDATLKSRIQGDDPPSTFQIWPGESLTPYAGADILKDLGDDVWTDDLRDNYLDGVQDLAQWDGTYVSVPINIHRLNNLFYNVSVVEDAGVDPSGLGSQDDLVDAMETVQSETDAVGMAHQTQHPWSTVQLWETVFVAEQGADAFDDLLAGNASAHEDGIRSALQYVSDFRDYYPEDAGSISWDQGNSKVINGEAAFIHQGDWAAGQYKATEDFAYGDDWDYVPYPGTGGVYALVMDSFVYPKDNPSPKKTTDFLSYCGTPDAQIRFNTAKGAIPPRTDVDESEFGPFLTQQIEHFGDSEAQPPTIAHGTGLDPNKKSDVEEAIAGFIEDWNVDETTSAIVSGIGG